MKIYTKNHVCLKSQPTRGAKREKFQEKLFLGIECFARVQ